MKKIRVLVVDDSVLFRNLLVQSLRSEEHTSELQSPS